MHKLKPYADVVTCISDADLAQRCAGNPFGLDHTLTSGIISGTGEASVDMCNALTCSSR